MLDLLKNELKIGDKVAYVSTKSKDLAQGTVVSINEKTIGIAPSLKKLEEEGKNYGKNYFTTYSRNAVKISDGKVIPESCIGAYLLEPVYVMEKVDGKWVGWWDILDKIESGCAFTAYSESFILSEYGKSWILFDDKPTEEEKASFFMISDV